MNKEPVSKLSEPAIIRGAPSMGMSNFSVRVSTALWLISKYSTKISNLSGREWGVGTGN